jgi:hypothetical protein
MNWLRGALLMTGGAALLALPACGVTRSSTDVHGYEVTGATTRLVIDDKAGHVNITTGDGPVRVTETIKYGRTRPTTAHTNVDGTVHLTAGDCWAIFDRGCEVDYQVRVPAATAVEIDASAGAVTVTGLTGDLKVTADAGTVQASGLRSAHTTVKADAGKVSLRYASTPSTVDAKSDAGSVDIWVPGGDAYAVDASTDAGKRSVGVRTDPNSTHHITAYSDAGSVRIHATGG